MGVLVILHLVKNILAKASKDSIPNLCILLLITNKVSGIHRFWKPLGHVTPKCYGDILSYDRQQVQAVDKWLGATGRSA